MMSSKDVRLIILVALFLAVVHIMEPFIQAAIYLLLLGGEPRTAPTKLPPHQAEGVEKWKRV